MFFIDRSRGGIYSKNAMGYVVPKIKEISGEWRPPGDKSISHRALMLAALATGESQLHHCLKAGDIQSTVEALRGLGVSIQSGDDVVRVKGVGLRGLKNPSHIIDVGNSGTTLRLLTGLLSAQEFSSVLTGDTSLRNRPMGPLIRALKTMGAQIKAVNDRAPISIRGALQPLSAMKVEFPFPSAQFKSAILLAGLYAEGVTEVKEALETRDHTERLMKVFGLPISKEEGRVRLEGVRGGDFPAQSIEVPGDMSSAAYLMTAALLHPKANVTVRSVGLNPTRIGFMDIVRAMGGQVVVDTCAGDDPWREASGDISVSSSDLRGGDVSGDLTIRAIDEIPLVVLLATQAIGQTVISDASVLRYKESDRLHVLARELGHMGASIQETSDGLVIEGPTRLRGCPVRSYHDHRIAMTLVLAGMIADGETEIDEIDSVAISFPGFLDALKSVSSS